MTTPIPPVHDRDIFWRDGMNNLILDPTDPVNEALHVLYLHYFSQKSFRAFFLPLLRMNDPEKVGPPTEEEEIELETVLYTEKPTIIVMKNSFPRTIYGCDNRVTHVEKIELNGWLVDRARWARKYQKSSYPYYLIALEVTLIHEYAFRFVSRIHGPDAKCPWNPQGTKLANRGECIEAEIFGGAFRFATTSYSGNLLISSAVVMAQEGKKDFDIDAIEQFQDGHIAHTNNLATFYQRAGENLIRSDQYWPKTEVEESMQLEPIRCELR